MIPPNIRKEHIIKAIKEVNKHGIPRGRISRKFLLEYKQRLYPPKYIISLANRYANGFELSPSDFEGGKPTNKFLILLGFRIANKPSEKNINKKRDNKTSKKPSKKSHNENCPECKRKIKILLEKIYGEAIVNYKLDIETDPENYQDSPFYHSLKKIYRSLQHYRGHNKFTRSKTLPNCDFYVPNPGFLVEFDESQHFTRAREIALSNYPENLPLGYNKEKWIRLCKRLNRKDNDPPYRDEQRAWYDTLRDFAFIKLGIPTVRLFARDEIWCDLDEENDNDITWFKNTIENKIKKYLQHADSNKEKDNLKIALAFPEFQKHDLNHFLKIVSNLSSPIDLLILPEGFEKITSEKVIEPEGINKVNEMQKLIKTYSKISKELGFSIIVGIAIDFRDRSLSGIGNDQYCLFVNPKGGKYIYHKHSTSRFTAFFDRDWSIQKNIRTIEAKNARIGISLCHDSYISLIPRVLKKKGAEIWVNLSHQNVRPAIWETVHQTRAAENDFISLCTLHRNSSGNNPQKEPYAFSEKGKIILKELKSGKNIHEIPTKKRAGNIFYFNTNKYEHHPLKKNKATKLANKAEVLHVDLKDSKIKLVDDRSCKYFIEHIDINEFVFSPEKIWKLCLKRKNKIPLFVVWAKDKNEWNQHKTKIDRIIKGRTIEFSTLFIFLESLSQKIFMAAYRSSNYKNSRIFYPDNFPVKFDKRYLKGLSSTLSISLTDHRKQDKDIYFKRIYKIIDFLEKN
jgi:predicted amidohydrolase